MKKLHYIIPVLVGLGQPTFAQQLQTLADGIVIDRQELKQNNDSVAVSLQLTLDQLELASVRSLTLTPVLTDGKVEKALTPMLLNGRNRHKVYRRHVALGHVSPHDYNTVRNVSRKKASPLYYNEQVAFEAWMSDAKLYLVADYCGCGGYADRQVREPLTAVLAPSPAVVAPIVAKPYEAQLMYCYAQPDRDIRKKRTELKDVYLNFPVNKIVIYPDYMHNNAELIKAQEMIEKINSEPNLTIQKIMFRGYASPEGSVPSNCRLSEGRAAALKNYLTPRLTNAAQLPMFSESGCEDWDGTIELLTASTLEGRDALLKAITECDRSDAAEMRLRTLNGGAPYAALLREIYPKVRRVVCSVDYSVREFTVDESRSLINEHPEWLSSYELYQLACSYPANSSEFLHALRTAEQLYPQDETTLLNGAMVALRDGNNEKAAANLQQVSTRNVVYLNAKGILLLRQNQKEAAKACFEEAVKLNSEAARTNLSELEKTMK